MADTYLPADVRKRIVDVMRERKMTQRELALRIDVNESTISRFLSGKTEKLSEESVIRIARVFNVSTDFILGTTVIPDKKNYDISELGLSVEAAKNLYTGKVNNDVVNRLLENPRFATVTYMIAQYLDDTLAGGYAAQNQMFATVGSLLLGQNQAPEAPEGELDERFVEACHKLEYVEYLNDLLLTSDQEERADTVKKLLTGGTIAKMQARLDEQKKEVRCHVREQEIA